MSPIIAFDDSDDPRLQPYSDLPAGARSGRGSELFVVEGKLCVERLIESPLETLSVLVDTGREEETRSWVGEGIAIFSLPKAKIRELVGYRFHRGVLACGRRPPIQDCRELAERLGPRQLAIAADGVTLRENLGSMCRSAAAFGVSNILLGPLSADPLARRSVRVSMGAVLKQQFYRLRDPVSDLSMMRNEFNIRTVVTTLSPNATPIEKFEPDDRPCVLVMGGEANGVCEEVQATASDRVTVPMKMGTDSLNVAVAAAVFLYEICRRQA